MRRFNQCLTQPAISLPGLAAQLFAGALLISWTDADPGSEMAGAGKPAPIGSNFSKDDFRQPLIHPRNGI
jgi:hypothetical protein